MTEKDTTIQPQERLRYSALPVAHSKLVAISRNVREVSMGSVVGGVPILERNRATVYASSEYEVGELLDYCLTNYQQKGVNAVLVAVADPPLVDGALPVILRPPLDKYIAVFVEDGFLIGDNDIE